MSEFLNQYIIKNDSLPIEFGESHPTAKGGVYALFNNDGGLLYIGKSLHIFNRITQHAWASDRGERRKFKFWCAVDTPEDLMGMIEVAHIHALQPPENTLPRPDHEHHEALVKAIKKEWGIEDESSNT
jgi:excinuclease UvrABC nuclease subunit